MIRIGGVSAPSFRCEIFPFLSSSNLLTNRVHSLLATMRMNMFLQVDGVVVGFETPRENVIIGKEYVVQEILGSSSNYCRSGRLWIDARDSWQCCALGYVPPSVPGSNYPSGMENCLIISIRGILVKRLIEVRRFYLEGYKM